MKRVLAFCLLCVMPALSAYTAPCPGQFGVSAEWLYMMSGYSQPYYVIDSLDTDQPLGSRISNDQEWHSGYRLEGIYAFCDCPTDVRLRWTHFPSFSDSDSTTSSQDLLRLINGPDSDGEVSDGSAAIRDTFDVHSLELVFGYGIYDSCCLSLDLQAGLQYAYIKLTEDIRFQDASDVFEDRIRSERWGIGPQVGYEFTYDLCGCLTLTGRGEAAFLISKRESSFLNLDDTSIEADVKNTDYWDLMPFTDIRFGLSYSTPLDLSCFSCMRGCGCMILDIEIGYEIMTYYNGLDRVYWAPDGQGRSIDNLMDLTLHGPYVHVGLSF